MPLPMHDLRVTIIQSNLTWEDPEANRRRFDTHLNSLVGETDVVVLCEMFTTGFTMNVKGVAEKHDSERMETLNWMRYHSRRLNAVVTGSIAVLEDDRAYNRLYWVLPDGRYNTYDKRHTFTFAGEDQHYHRGSSRIVEEWKGWRICPLICYDLRFPVWSRNGLADGKPDFDLLIYVANWPEVRREPWMKLMQARAIENQCYLAGVNRVGADNNGLNYSGDSQLIDSKGQIIVHHGEGKEAVSTSLLSGSELADFRNKFPVLHDADSFILDALRRK